MATNELKLAQAFRDAGLPQDKAEVVSQTIFDAIRDNVATKADVELVRRDVELVRSGLETRLAQLETRLSVRMGAMVTAAAAILIGVKFFG